MAGRGRIVAGVFLMLISFGLFLLPTFLGIALGGLLFLIALVLIISGAMKWRKGRDAAAAAPVFSATASTAPGPATCRACGMTNMLGATRCSRCGSPL